jgi:Zn finger protein HypA/HybF involved in hydrogenase expression
MPGWTFQSLIDDRQRIEAYCDDCRFHKRLDLEAMKQHFGPDHPAMAWDLKRILHCPKCGSKNTAFIYGYDSGKPQMIETWGTPSATTPKR